MKSKTERKSWRAARKAGSMAEPRPPFPKQPQKAPGLESKLRLRPRYEAGTVLQVMGGETTGG